MNRVKIGNFTESTMLSEFKAKSNIFIDTHLYLIRKMCVLFFCIFTSNNYAMRYKY